MTAARLAHTHHSPINDARTRASPVKLRFIRSPTSATLSNAASSTTSRIPLPRSVSAPDKLNKGDTMYEHEDGVQMASYPTLTPPPAISLSPIPSSSRSNAVMLVATSELDHPHGPEAHDGEASSGRMTSSHHNTHITSPSSSASVSSTSYASSIVFPSSNSSTRLHAQQQQHIQIQSPTPPKRHPLRPVLRSPPLSSAQSNALPAAVVVVVVADNTFLLGVVPVVLLFNCLSPCRRLKEVDLENEFEEGAFSLSSSMYVEDTLARLFKPDLAGERDNELDEPALFESGLTEVCSLPVPDVVKSVEKMFFCFDCVDAV